MGRIPFNIVDVFTSGEPFTGNQLSVVMAAGKGLSGTTMQRIAREFNFSETTFVTSDGPVNGGHDVRIFTLTDEVPFAGHPTLGTAFVLARAATPGSPATVVLNLGIGRIHVSIEYGEKGPTRLTMRQRQPEFGNKKLPPGALAAVLGLPVAAISADFPVLEVSTGLPFIIVPISSLEHLDSIKLDMDAYGNLIKNTAAKAIYAFCLQTGGQGLTARMFAPHYGIAEDPATGSGCGCLGGYLVHTGALGAGPVSVTVQQGSAVGRASLLYLDARRVGGAIEVMVGGAVAAVAEGFLLIP